MSRPRQRDTRLDPLDPPPASPAALPVAPYPLARLVVVIALCNVAFMAFNTVIGPIARVARLPEWQVGLVVSLAGLCWMLAARPWGRAADRLGRLPVLRRGMAAFVALFALLAASIHLTLAGVAGATFLFVAMLVLRGLLGVAYAAVPIAGQALIADAFPPERRTGAMATLGAASGVAMVLGPAMAAVLGSISLRAPLVGIVALSAVGWALAWRVPAVPGSPVVAAGGRVSLALFDARLLGPAAVAFGAMFCVMSAQVNTAFFVMDRLQVPGDQATRMTGLVLVSVGVALVAAQMMVRANAARPRSWTPTRLIRVGALLAAIGFAATPFAGAVWQAACAYFAAGFGMGFVFPAYLAAASTAVRPDEQGAAMGTVGAAQAAGMVVAPIASTALYQVDPSLPFWVAALVLVAMAAVVGRRSAHAPGAGPRRPG